MPVPPCIPKTNNYEKVLSSKIHSLFVHSISIDMKSFFVYFFGENRKLSFSRKIEKILVPRIRPKNFEYLFSIWNE